MSISEDVLTKVREAKVKLLAAQSALASAGVRLQHSKREGIAAERDYDLAEDRLARAQVVYDEAAGILADEATK